MKKLIYLWLLASVLLPAACTDDDDVFSEESGVRLQAVIDECNTTLRGAENGWKMVYYPKVESYGGYTFLFKFGAKNRVQMISDFDTSEDTDYSYNFNTSESVVLTFDSYSPLHRLADPQYPAPDYSNKKGYGVEGDFEFVVKKVTADTLYLVGKKNRVEIPLTRASAESWEELRSAAAIDSYFSITNDELLQMSVDGVKKLEAMVSINDVYRIFTVTYEENGEEVEIFSPYIVTETGCEFTKELTIMGVKFTGLDVEQSIPFAQRTFISNDAGNRIAFKVKYNGPLNLTPEDIPTYEPDPDVLSVELLRSSHEKYVVTAMGTRLQMIEDALREELPDFVGFGMFIDRDEKNPGVMSFSAMDDGTEKFYYYGFDEFTMLNGTNNQVYFDKSGKYGAGNKYTSGWTGRTAYTGNANMTKMRTGFFFLKTGHTVIFDSKDVFWIRSNEDPNDWWKLEAAD